MLGFTILPKLIKCDDYVYEINNPTCTSEGLEIFIYKNNVI